MMTREEVLSIEEYCAEHKISHKKHLGYRSGTSIRQSRNIGRKVSRMKILHREEDGLVLYALRIEMGRMHNA